MDAIEFQTMIDADDRHWWYRGRRRIVVGAIERLALRPGARILDAGCGSGRMLDELARWGHVSGLDAEPRGVAAARSRGHGDVRLGSVEELPWSDGLFDLVTCLDVIEHTSDDQRTLAELRRVTRPGGHLLVTVPAYPWLWSAHDVANHHHRRYTRDSLRAASGAAGWHALLETSFNAILLVPVTLVRWAERLRRGERTRSDLQLTPAPLGALLEFALRIEAALLRRGVRLPAGVSILAVLRNPERAGTGT
ncbi:class I SAM-dependent methyltransferase [soil metagenome]